MTEIQLDYPTMILLETRSVEPKLRADKVVVWPFVVSDHMQHIVNVQLCQKIVLCGSVFTRIIVFGQTQSTATEAPFSQYYYRFLGRRFSFALPVDNRISRMMMMMMMMMIGLPKVLQFTRHKSSRSPSQQHYHGIALQQSSATVLASIALATVWCSSIRLFWFPETACLEHRYYRLVAC
jgi:hypothetical protein